MTFGSLFAGIGGFDLGFERAGLTCSWQVEIDPFCRQVLAKHWPNVRRHCDVRTFPPRVFEFSYSWRGCPVGEFLPDVKRDVTAAEWAVDVICGGFPCQDISAAGKGKGLAGERSGLWSEFRRCIGVIRPGIVVVENSPRLTSRGLSTVLGDLATLGFDAEWHCIPAAAFGAPHERDRIWIIAHTASDGCGPGRTGRFIDRLPWLPDEARWNPADAGSTGQNEGCTKSKWSKLTGGDPSVDVWQSTWPDEPALLGMDDGIPNRVDRVRAVGNSVVPQITEFIGRRIANRAALLAGKE